LVTSDSSLAGFNIKPDVAPAAIWLIVAGASLPAEAIWEH
jgi:hypothetical protein